MPARQYRLVLFDTSGAPVQALMYMHVKRRDSDARLRIDLRQGRGSYVG
jgi:hypothetical protein